MSAICCSRPAETRFVALLVLLHLLKGQPDPLGEPGLRQAALQPQRPDFAPDLDILGARPAFADAPFA